MTNFRLSTLKYNAKIFLCSKENKNKSFERNKALENVTEIEVRSIIEIPSTEV